MEFKHELKECVSNPNLIGCSIGKEDGNPNLIGCSIGKEDGKKMFVPIHSIDITNLVNIPPMILLVNFAYPFVWE